MRQTPGPPLGTERGFHTQSQRLDISREPYTAIQHKGMYPLVPLNNTTILPIYNILSIGKHRNSAYTQKDRPILSDLCSDNYYRGPLRTEKMPSCRCVEPAFCHLRPNPPLLSFDDLDSAAYNSDILQKEIFMEFNQGDDYLESSPFNRDRPDPDPPAQTPPPMRPVPSYQPYPPPRKKSRGWRVFWGILFTLSVLANIGMFLLLIGVFIAIASGQIDQYQMTVLQEGAPDQRIAVIDLTGTIDDDQADEIHRQIQVVRKDEGIRGIVLRVNSPGGTVSGSDRIYEELRQYREEHQLPIVAFMQGVAASGGYYAAVACEEIIAEPTTITGSIGVIMSHFVLKDLLQNKLGIEPVFLTAGNRKDWPSSFRNPSEEELQYLRERILTPAYERFVDVVRQGRSAVLTPSEVSQLADGSVYTAPKARDVKLIDEVGYFDDAIASVAAKAHLSTPQVVEYQRPFSLISLLEARSIPAIKLDRSTLYEMSAPQIMYLWNAY